ncbi:TetR family transcriptional regulator C-terminal domain-containing protein [Nitratireductor sp. GCM10026969]|uniref:TetR family transcriptional regulator C-terminal domain-containing protein n=1 Tax=Nitratireductor sp. GCM10026969 TaxID=3252645 RepID=UPI00360D7F05
MRPDDSAELTGEAGRTRIQRERREAILEAALEVFSRDGFRGATLDRIALVAGMSKPNVLYYFKSKEAIFLTLVDRIMELWLAPLRAMDAGGDPVAEIRAYIRRKVEMSRDFPRESRLFANEILQGAPRILPFLQGELKALVDEKAAIIGAWMRQGRLKALDPHHFIFAIWATTQHYADFDVQVCAVLGPERSGERRFEEAARFLEGLFLG